MDQIFGKKPNPQMLSLLVFNRVYRLEMQAVILVFSIPLVDQRHSNLLTGSPTSTWGDLRQIDTFRQVPLLANF
jgi:hypothetical protein